MKKTHGFILIGVGILSIVFGSIFLASSKGDKIAKDSSIQPLASDIVSINEDVPAVDEMSSAKIEIPVKKESPKETIKTKKHSEESETSNNKTKVGLPDNVKKGNLFEEYVVKTFDFSRNSLSLVNTANNTGNTPDLEIDLKAGGKNYRLAIECVWRKALPNKELEWANKTKVEMLKMYTKTNDAKIFVVIGIGGEPSAPAAIYAVPFDEKPYETFYTSVIKKYEIKSLNGKFFYDTKEGTLTIK